MHLLHIEGSPRKSRSASIDVARSFLAAWQAEHPDGTVDTIDVWTESLPAFDGPALDAKYAKLSGQPLTGEQEAVWQEITRLGARFHRADILLVSVPMWNFGIPYQLKHLIDAVSQKDVLFTFDERGLNGMLGGRKAVIVAARGVALDADFPPEDFDFQVAYLERWCRMIGITDIREILVERTLFGPEADAAARTEAKAEAAKLAAAL
jgi:FMN-dependent NADH-azoreductase